ncbi:hypothetical protein [Microbulbifer sp. 2205BS26-8]|uniref:hypothetical protein n=1 Tax=Microbulbifer sp. 2205BS26-8 TaxID=3064386 RepID=UPI00273F9D93|nr:hypothetical protein [Microbulbifer sp. 2205BS26-8]MDP5211045.1 hypothetical protein [Microbulbifer sp. 2205BS26-8]
MIKYLVIAIISCFATYLLKDTVSSLEYSAYKAVLAALLNISSIIFAIIGAWIAIIYPRAIGRAFKGKQVTDQTLKDADTDADYLSQLVEIVLVSAIVLMFVLSIEFSVPIVKNLITGNWLAYSKYAAFFLVSLLTLSQLYAVSRVILANYFFLNDLRKKNADGKVDTLHL